MTTRPHTPDEVPSLNPATEPPAVCDPAEQSASPIVANWVPDQLLSGFEACVIPVAGPAYPGDPDQGLTVTLVRPIGDSGRSRDSGRGGSRAVLYVHGWSDYFFQAHLADFWRDQGVDFFALDLRRYGRNLVDDQLGGFVADLDEYFADLDAALEIIRASHDDIALMAHSTGGLIGVLYADARPDAFSALLLNSPWLDLHGSTLFRTVTASVVKQLGSRTPTSTLPLPDSGTYARAIDAQLDGEWTYDHVRKGGSAFAIRPGWLKAIVQGQARVSAGLSIDAPILVMVSARSDFRRRWDPDALTSADTVLDVRNLARAAMSLGHSTTLVRIDGGLHDLVLSRAEVRNQVFGEITTWMRAYWPVLSS